jgi:hypothetical protein
MRSLRRLVEARRSLVDDRVRLTNRITAALKSNLPQVLDWFRDKDAAVFADFLESWRTLELARRARRETLTDFFRSHNVRNQAAIDRRLEAIRIDRAETCQTTKRRGRDVSRRSADGPAHRSRPPALCSPRPPSLSLGPPTPLAARTRGIRRRRLLG